jgi:hypothetical protein
MGKAFRFGVNEEGGSLVEAVDFDGSENTLSEIYRVGGWNMTEVAVSGKYGETSVVLWADEEGLYREPLIRNDAATSLRNEIMRGFFDGIYGTCVLTAEDEDGRTLSLTDEQVAEITKLLDLGGYPLA